MKYYKYTAKIRHDNGMFTINVIATTASAAREIICKAEGCPDRAILTLIQGEQL